LAATLGLNEVGLCALGCGQYPLPDAAPLPFCVYPLRMTHGVGFANAYLVADCGASHGLLFDTGPGMKALEAEWPAAIKTVDAVFLTHAEAEHAGGLCGRGGALWLVHRLLPGWAEIPCGQAMAEGERRKFGQLEVTALSTPGHSSAHNCYLITAPLAQPGGSLLISGDLIFAGSVGAAISATASSPRICVGSRCCSAADRDCPGHGPLTTAENELRYNPFVV